MVRQFLGIYATFTEDPIRKGVRDAYYKAKAAGARAIWGIVLSEIDRAQDSEGVTDQVLELLQQARAKTKATAA
jgi:anti-sigma factor ChrR (cupin superfamily)